MGFLHASHLVQFFISDDLHAGEVQDTTRRKIRINEGKDASLPQSDAQMTRLHSRVFSWVKAADSVFFRVLPLISVLQLVVYSK